MSTFYIIDMTNILIETFNLKGIFTVKLLIYFTNKQKIFKKLFPTKNT